MTLSTDKIFTLLYSLCSFIDYIPFPDFVIKKSHQTDALVFQSCIDPKQRQSLTNVNKNAVEGLKQYRPEKRGNLSPWVLVKNESHEVFHLVPLRGEVSESVPHFRSMLQ